MRSSDAHDVPPSAEASGPIGDAALLRAAQRGDTLAITRLISRHEGHLLRLATLMMGTPSEGEEAYQEGMLSVHRALHRASFPPEGDRQVRAWLVRIVVNAALMALRARRRRPVLSLEELPALGEGEGSAELQPNSWAPLPDEALMHREKREELMAALLSLPEKYRLVVWLRDVDEHTNEEVAVALGLTVPTVKARLHRARHAVRRALYGTSLVRGLELKE